MPSYEATFVIKKMVKPETATVLKRIALQIMQNNGILFAIENLGTRGLPYKMRSHGTNYQEGSYFLLKFDASPKILDTLADEYKRDVDIIRAGFVSSKPEAPHNCTLEEDLKPPAYRESVQKMIKEGRKTERLYNTNTGLSYDPWKR